LQNDLSKERQQPGVERYLKGISVIDREQNANGQNGFIHQSNERRNEIGWGKWNKFHIEIKQKFFSAYSLGCSMGSFLFFQVKGKYNQDR
jgi:hypothetical protein